MVWDGMERREGKNFCQAHIDFVKDMAVIKESLKNIEKTITEGVTFKNGVVIACIGNALALIIAITTFAFMIGGIDKQVEVNTKIIQNHMVSR